MNKQYFYEINGVQQESNGPLFLKDVPELIRRHADEIGSGHVEVIVQRENDGREFVFKLSRMELEDNVDLFMNYMENGR